MQHTKSFSTDPLKLKYPFRVPQGISGLIRYCATQWQN